jgi:hypothetical protein
MTIADMVPWFAVGTGVALLFFVFRKKPTAADESNVLPPDKDQDVEDARVFMKSLGEAVDGLDDASWTKEQVKLLEQQVVDGRKVYAQTLRQMKHTMQIIRADHTRKTRRRMPAMRGGGGIGRFVRAVQGANRHGDRVQLSYDLEEHEAKADYFQACINHLDTMKNVIRAKLQQF